MAFTIAAPLAWPIGATCGFHVVGAANGFTPALDATLRPAAGARRAIEVELRKAWMVPGESRARVRVARLVSSGTFEFSTGWRLDCDAAEVVPYPGRNGADLLRINCSDATFRQGPVLREYFGVTSDDRLALVRLEAPDGTFAGLNVYASGQAIGPLPPRRGRDGWLAALRSEDRITALEALNWLGGRHIDAKLNPGRPAGVLLESVEDAVDATAAQEDPAVLAAIDALKGDADPWIAEAAATASKAIAEFFGPAARSSGARRERRRSSERRRGRARRRC